MKKNRRMMKKNEKIEVKEEKGIWRYKGGQQIDLGRKKARTLNGYLYAGMAKFELCSNVRIFQNSNRFFRIRSNNSNTLLLCVFN